MTVKYKKLNEETLSAIVKKWANNPWNYIRTVRYIMKCRTSNKEIYLIWNFSVDINFFKALFYHLFKYLFIAFELNDARLKIFYHLFDKYSEDFNDSVFCWIIANQSNRWLDLDYRKIMLLKDFCEEMFRSGNLCEQICKKAKITVNQYYSIINASIDIMGERIKKTYAEYRKTQIKKINREGSLLSDRYKESFEDTSFLKKK